MRAALHQTFRYVDASGWRASCWCQWSVTRKTRELRDQDADAHDVTPAAELATADLARVFGGGAG